MSQYLFRQLKPTSELWCHIEASPDSSVFTSAQWHSYLNQQHQATIIISVASIDGTIIGHFVGSRKWYGLNIIGAPLGGTATYLGGLCMDCTIDDKKRIEIYQQLADWYFRKGKAAYIQVTDWALRNEYPEYVSTDAWHQPLLEQAGIHYTPRITFMIDTSLPEDEIWHRTSYSSFRYCVNKAKKEGLTVKLITDRGDIPSFIDTLHRQIMDVSRRKGVAPHIHQSAERLKELCKNLFPDRVLMVQVSGNDSEGIHQKMSSAIFCIDKNVGTYLSGASFQQFMKYCPNEIMVWEALRELHRRGVHHLILGDTAPYKQKFGPTFVYLPMMIFSRWKLLLNARANIKQAYWKLRNIISK